MKARLDLRWSLGATEIEPRVIELLRGIAEHGSLQGAVAGAKMSYRHAWDRLGRLENALGARLVVLERGRGARLAPLGAQLLAATDGAATELAPHLKRVEATLARHLTTPRAGTRARVRVHASHDLALLRLRDRLERSRRFRFELHFQGSLDCLAALKRGQCDLAGFHVPNTAAPGALLAQFRPWLREKTLRLLHLVNRQQGLLVARGNPLRLETMGDLVRTRASFVNRQPGSGTRLCFDHLLAANRIRPGQINGYQHEEFTHAAVAATVASGMAQAGFGIEAAAREQRLDFVPVITERYFLAGRAATWERPGAAALLASLRGSALKAVVGALPGYVLPQALDLVTVHDAIEAA
jgi:molybdate transport repressor ModE-like protein